MRQSLRVKVYADGARPGAVNAAIVEHGVAGFTTNPTLMAAAGVGDYLDFAARMVEEVGRLPLSLEVLADDHAEMIRQARLLSGLGESVYVKIPITTTTGESCVPVVSALHQEGVRVNATAVFTRPQIDALSGVLTASTPAVVSVFAGRIADAGIDPTTTARHAVDAVSDRRHVEVLWASCREVYNVVQADQAGCDIITVPFDLLPKLDTLGRDLDLFSLDTVRMFHADARKSGYSL